MTAHVVDRLSAYLDAELEASERQAVEAHLRHCDGCARHLEDLAAVDEMARALPLEAPGGYFETLPGRVRFKVAARRRRASLPVWSWAVAAALLLAVVTPALLRRSPAPLEVPRSVAPASTPAAAPAPGAPVADAKEQPPLGGALREAPQEKQRSAASSYDELQSAARKRAPEARLQGPAAPAPVEGLAQGALARKETPPLAKSESERAKDKAPPATAEEPARAPSAPAASAAFATSPEGALSGAAGQHLVEPKPEADDADSAATAEEAKKVGSATNSAGAVRRDAEAGRSERRAPKLRFRSLEAAVPGSAEEARSLREQWRAFVAQGPPAAQADEGRVRIVQMGVQAWRLSNDPTDLILVKRDGENYLRRADAAQGDRVRALLSTVGN